MMQTAEDACCAGGHPQGDPPRISVVIPAYNAAATIDRCLEALTHQTEPPEAYEVIVVDDGSMDETSVRVRAHPGVRLLEAAHAGPAAARNLGAVHAQGDTLLFTDADCAPAADWIERMVAPLRQAGTAVMPSAGQPQPEAIVGVKGAYLSRQRELVARFVQLEYEEKYDHTARERFIDFVDTYAAGYRRDVFLQEEGFDTTFPTASVEDQEFSFRLAAAGYRMVFAPEARVYHWGHPRDLLAYCKRKFKIGYWKVLVHRRHPGKLVRDSHTPQSLRAQVLLVALGAMGLILSILWPVLLWAVLVAGLLFALSTLSFVLRAWRRDRPVALLSPFMLLLRAMALGTGFGVGLLVHVGAAFKGRNGLLKRSMDVVGSLLGIILTAPLMLVTALLVKLQSPGPVLFAQNRAGQGGRAYRILKFRTMVHNAEDLLDELLDLDSLDEPVFKIPNDPRVTRLGRFLRRWSIDELPQFFNVLWGDMSLVGPRPEETRLVERYNDWHKNRLLAKPGVTGPVQVHGRADLSLQDRVELEIDYINNYSLGRDIRILLATIPAVIRGDGCY